MSRKIQRNVDRDKMCGEKRRYISRNDAQRSNPSVYACPYCRKWHGSRGARDKRRFETILRQEQAKDSKLFLFAWNQADIQGVYNELINNGAQVKFVFRDSRYEIRMK